MIISKVLKFVAGKISTLAGKSADNPKTANTLSLLSGASGLLGISESSRIGLADTLLAVSEFLRTL